MSPPRPPSPPGDTTSDTEDKSDSARRVTLESLECLLHFQASQREQELAELARLVAFSLTRPAVPSDRAQRDAVLSAASIHELGDALRHQFAGPDSSAVIADIQLNIMTLERDRLLDLSKQSTAFTASLRKSVAELEAQAAVARSQADAQVAAAFRHADGFKRQVQDRDQEIAALRVSIADRDRAYADLQGVASKHFAQLQESTRLFDDGGSQPLCHAQSVISHQWAVILLQKWFIARQGSIPMHDPHMAAAAAGGLDAPVSATAAGSRRKPHQPPDQPYSIPLPGEEGHEEVMELLSGDDLGAMSDGQLLRHSAVSSRRQRHRRRASSSVTPSSAAKVARPASAAGDEPPFDFDLGDPMEDVELDVSAEVGVSATSSTGAVSTTGTSSVVAATSSPVTATSSTTVTTVVSAAPTVDSAVVSCSTPQDSSISTATSSSAATASSSAVLASMSSCSAESASADSSVPTSLPIASSAARLSASCSTASTIGLASSAGLDVSTPILLLAPFPTSGVVTSAPSSAGPVVASAPVLSSTLTPTPSSSTSLVATSTASSTLMSIPATSSAVITAPMTISAPVALPAAGSVGVSTSAPCPVGSISVSTPNSAMLRVLGCSRQTPALKPSGAASTVVTAVPESAAIAASLSSHYLTELSVSNRVALGLGGSAESSSDSTSRGAGSSAKPLKLLSGSSDAESERVAASSAENESSRGQTGDPGDQVTTAPHPKARALSSATPALDGDDSSNDCDDISLRDLVSRMQTGRVATHGKAQPYLALDGTPTSSPRSSDSAGALSVQRSSSFPKKTKEKKERRKHKHCHKHTHQSKHRNKHKRRLSALGDSAVSAGDADHPRRSKRLVSSDSAVRSRPSKKSRRDLPPSSSRLIKLRGEIPSPTKPGNSTSLARDDHPTRYFVALWERTHWDVESSVMMGLHPSQQASRSYEEIADMYAEWFQYKLCRKRRSDALRSLMATISDDLYSAVVKSIGGVPAPDVDAELYFEPSVPVYLLVNLSWIPGRSDWCQAVSEVDSTESWRTWWLTDPARHPYNACFRARNVDFLPFAPPGVYPNIVEAAVEDDVDLTEPDPPIRSTSAPPARDARDGSDGSPSDSSFGPDSPDLAGSLSSALGSSVGTSSQVSSSVGQRSRMGNSADHSVHGQDSAKYMLVNAASAISQAPSPNAPVTL
ncbi:unnamed protein product [Phytophthora fragariaefolia]|uniref:Unnamed protein product n=1 Tax=Phytophthora fragariaefolia TaxID=1490495 RepID=A0A9W7DBQ4_9STRA|nr:unnamed protein product [Phytophthora fragariaefolia]